MEAGQMKRWMIKNHKIGIFMTVALTLLVICLGIRLAWNDPEETETYHLIFIPKTIDPANGFWTALIDGAKLGAEEMGAEIEVMGAGAEEDVEEQIEIIRQSMEKEPDALLVAPGDYSEVSDVLQEVVDAGIPLILLDSVIDRDIAVSEIGTDNYRAGKELGEYAATLIDGEGEIGIVSHVKGSSTAMERSNGICDGMGEASHQIRSIVYCNSSYEKAYELTKDMLNRYPQISLLVATNEYGAIGAARAVNDLGLAGKVKMVGFDSSVEEIQLLEMGVFQAIIIQKPVNMGYLGVEQAIHVLNGKKAEPKLDSGSKLITKENLYEDENQRLLYPFSGQ